MAKPKRNKDGNIINAEELTADDVALEKVLCPRCEQPFKKWPFGWDAHSPTRCKNLNGTQKQRKCQFKENYLHLFKNKDMSRYK